MDKLYEHDFGQSLQITGLTLTGPTVEAHFCIKGNDDSVLVMGTLDGDVAIVPVPNSMLEDAGLINTYIYERNDTAGKTVYKFELRVERRADLPAATYDPTEEEVSYFTHVIEVITEQAEIVQATKDELLAGLTIGGVETLPAGSAATADLVEDGGKIKLDLGIPQGEKGEKGEKGDTERLTVDAEISATSTNPVQNKVIKSNIDKLQDEIDNFTVITDATLTREDIAADAKAVGDAITLTPSEISTLTELLTVGDAITSVGDALTLTSSEISTLTGLLN